MTSSQLPGNAFAEYGDSTSEQQLQTAAVMTARAAPQSATGPRFHEAANGQIPLPEPQPAAERPLKRPETSGEREEIAKRIAAFRNLQISLKREREDYYERTLARTRAALASDAKSPR